MDTRRTKIILTVVLSLLILAGGCGLYLVSDIGGDEEKTGTTEETYSSLDDLVEEEGETEASSSEETSNPVAGLAGNPHVFAHRGASGDEVEHTIRAYDEAIAQGADHIEQDVVLSKDGTLYVSHDLSAGRITGVDRNYADMTDAEIDERTTSDGQHIPKLSEVFDRYGKSVTYVIELKDQGTSTEALIDLIGQYGMEENVIVQCKMRAALEMVKGALPAARTLFLTSGQGEFDEGLDLSYVDILSQKSSDMSSSNCQKAHEKGKQYNVWTLNEEGEITQAIEMGVDSYFTDYPGKAIQLEEQYRKE